MKSLLDIVIESTDSIPKRIRVQHPSIPEKTVVVETIPEIAWSHIYPLSYHDELNWQRRIPGESKSGITLCYEEGNYTYFLLEQPGGKNWDLVGLYNLKDEMLYVNTTLGNFQSWMGANFSVTMTEMVPETPF